MRPTSPILAAVLVGAASAQDFPNLESPQTHAIAASADGTRLYAVNTPDARLAIYDLRDVRRPVLLGEVGVGLEPVAVRPRTADEVWVVDHLSDAVTVVDVRNFAVIDTLACEDEPADVAFAGGKAFVSCATDRQVLVFDAVTRQRLGAVAVFADEPRALAVAADGQHVYAVAHRSGNRTTLVPRDLAPPQAAPTNPSLPPPPAVSLIVDSLDPLWQSAHGMTLPDEDVFEIDVSTLAVTRRVVGVGTILFGAAFRPGSDELWVTNTEARNLEQFEPVLRGRAVEHRVTRIDLGGAYPLVNAVDLQPGLDYAILPNPPAIATSLAQPSGIAFAPDGSVGYVAAFGSDLVGVLDSSGQVVARIAVGATRSPTSSTRAMRGPRALVHHPSASVLYVLNRLMNTVSVIDTGARAEIAELPLVFDPTPPALKAGRGFLYDARLSGNGTMSCAVCHVDGTVDGLAWDLGDPGGEMAQVRDGNGMPVDIHPMKGPMVTQTLQGLRGLEPLHWRGDRSVFQDFNGAFASLMGGSTLSTTDIDAFAAFADTILLPPNPNREPDGSLPDDGSGLSARDGFDFFTTTALATGQICVQCHLLDAGSSRLIVSSPIAGEQPFKVPQLRTLYKRTGSQPLQGVSTAGFGFEHDGGFQTLDAFLSKPVFAPLDSSPNDRRKLERFLLAFDTGTAPAVGRARSLDAGNRLDAGVQADWDLLEAQAALGRCDLVARGTFDGEPVGFVWRPVQSVWDMDRAGQSHPRAQLDSWLASGRLRITLLGVWPGEGTRIGIDRDRDGVRDGDEGLSSYGTSTAGCGLALAGNSPPVLGNQQFALVCRGVPAGSPGIMLLSAATANLPVLGIELLVDAGRSLVVSVTGDAHGVAAMPLPIGATPALLGATVHGQAAFVSTCGSQGLAASNGLTVVVGAP